MADRVILDAAAYYCGPGRPPAPHLTPLKPVPITVPDVDSDFDNPTGHRRRQPARPRGRRHDPYQNAHMPPPMPPPMPYNSQYDVGLNPFQPPPVHPVPPPPPVGMPDIADLEPLDDDELMLCVHHVPGFTLKNKSWGM